MKHLLLVLLFCTFFANAQDNFVPASYVDNNDRIVNGLINDLQWNENPRSFEFKSSVDKEKITLGISDVKSFKIDNGSHFYRHTVDIDKASDQIANLDNKREPNLKTETVFLKALLDGDVALFKYKNNAKNHFYYKKGNFIHYLIYKRYLNGVSSIAENNSYQQQLAVNLNCTNGKSLNSENISYRESSLIKYFEKYYACNDLQIADRFIQKKKIEYGVKVLGGLYLNSFEVNSNQRRTFDYGSNTGILIGLETEAILPNKKWSFFIDARPHKFTGNESFDVPNPLNNETTSIPTEATYTAVDFGFGSRYYTYASKDIAIYVGLNTSIDFITNSEVVYNDPNASDFSDVGGNLAIGLGVGVHLNNFNCEVRYHTPRDTLVAGATESIYNLLMFNLSYKIISF